MRFNKLGLFAMTSFVYLSCSMESANKDEYIIGAPVKGVSGISSTEGAYANQLAIYDETVNLIHKFDVSSLKHKASLEVSSPEATHHILSADDGRFVIDMSKEGGINLYNARGELIPEPVKSFGTPLSAAFKNHLDFVVIYDDLMSISVLKLDERGEVAGTFVSGPIVSGTDQIVSGDLSSTGELILALTHGKIAIVDLDQTIEAQEWTSRTIQVGLEDMRWVAPVAANPDQILVRATDKLTLIDLSNGSTLAEVELTESEIVGYSKDGTPHVFSKAGGVDYQTVYFVDESTIQSRMLSKSYDRITHSVMDLEERTWTLIEEEDSGKGELRYLHQYRLDTMAVQSSYELPKNADVNLAPNYVFALFPSELGLAKRFSLDGEEVTETKLFNLKYMK